jgi:EAL domain-containing protein (putative c-di-GMP-specific phosphodiesterase class I)
MALSRRGTDAKRYLEGNPEFDPFWFREPTAMNIESLNKAQGVVVVPSHGTTLGKGRGKFFMGPDWMSDCLAWAAAWPEMDRRQSMARLIGVSEAPVSLDQLERVLRLRWLLDLIDSRKIACHFQPVVSFCDRSTVGFESMMRAELAGSVVTGGVLIESAKALKVLDRLDLLAIETAILTGGPQLLRAERLFINVQPSTLAVPDAVVNVAMGAIEKAGVNPGRIVFEVVETEPLPEVQALADFRNAIKARGARLALDDVGSGYGALTNILDLKPDYVKFDAELMRHREDEGVAELVYGLVRSSHGAGAMVVVEGIEDRVDWEFARSVGADLGQGYFVGRPQAAMRRDWAWRQAAGTSSMLTA